MNKASISDKMQFKSILQAIIETGEKEHMSKNMTEDYINEDIKKGTKQGIQQAVGQEKRAAEQEAFKLLQAGMCCSEISKITGLSREEIKSLDNNHECSDQLNL